ncbi:YdcF family protein [Haloprofundus halophilus]|uniref:YdcF family protein n=1 Tax=Haloprofundus halophilus TaxID=2283527 RepID=UPI001300314B|nr:YdcF family protein [Haloprofundus halophilus]
MVIVVLGDRLRSNAIHPHLRKRVDAGIDALQATDGRYLLVTGAATNPDVPRAECEVMADYAVSRGVAPERVLLEDHAYDTRGNGYFARLLVDEHAPDTETVSVVSSRMHLRRARYIFERCFGDAYEIDTSRAVDPEPEYDDFTESEIRRLHEEDREFFDGITPGDTDAIRRRLAADDPAYRWLAENKE